MSTFTEQARRRQLVDVTIALVAEHGPARCSLQRIADAAGVTKAGVLYHFRTKDAVIRAAYDEVLAGLTGEVGRAVDAAATPAGAVEAYVTAMVGHLARHPDHGRMLAAALADPASTGIHDRDDRPARWRPLAALIAATGADDVDARALAVVLGGAIDGVVAELLDDPAFDPDAAAAEIVGMLRARLPR